MKAKIDLDKFVRSLMERYYEKIHIDPTTTKCWLDSVLEDQGLKYKDGEIVEIEQEQPSEKDYEDLSIINEGDDGVLLYFTKDGRGISDFRISKDTARWLHGKLGEYLEMFDDEQPKEQEEREDIRKRYERIGNSDWFKKNHVGISIGEQPLEEDVVGMGELGKAWNEQAIISRLDKIIELLSWKPSPNIIPYPYTQPITYKRPLDPDPNVLGGWATTANTFGADYDIDTDKIKQDETSKPKS